jgi:RNA polymerase sigma factor (sigma-70 family)
MREDTTLADLIIQAKDGDQHAWNEVVHRYAPLVWSICRRYQLSRADIDDIGQIVWLLLVEHLGNLRTPAALPGWLATTTHRECFRVLRVSRRYEFVGSATDIEAPADQPEQTVEQEIVAAELSAALRTAFAELPPRCRQLLGLLMSDPPVPYAQISAAVSIPIGSIGPQRARCLTKMRRAPALAALDSGDISADAITSRANPSAEGKAYA